VRRFSRFGSGFNAEKIWLPPLAKKNMFTFTGIFVVINIFFLSVGALLYIYAAKTELKYQQI
jgi:hypothetical protein